MSHRSFENIKLTLRPSLNYTTVQAFGKPSHVFRGVFEGFSLPVWSSDNEELYFTIKTPERWDGVTDPIVKMHFWLEDGETVGDKFKMQLSVASTNCGGVLSSSSSDIEVETTIITGHNSQYDVYCVDFTVDASALSMTAGDILASRLRRIASTTPAISNEVVAFDWNVVFKRDRLGGTFT